MEIKTEIKIRINEENEMVLDELEARELYTRLKTLFGNNYIETSPNHLRNTGTSNMNVWPVTTIS